MRRRRSMHSPDDGLHPNSTFPPAMPTSEYIRIKNTTVATLSSALSFCMLNACELGLLRQGTVHLSNYSLHASHTEIDPRTIRELSNGGLLWHK